jgi:tetratricopeptide (TPR) repeat protein
MTLDPHSVEARSRLATVLTSRVLEGWNPDTAAVDIARAEELAGQALSASPRSPLAHFARGQVLRAQNRYGEAIPEYETVIALARNAVGAIAALADCKLYVGPIEEVIPLQEQALRLDPRDPNISNMYGRIGRVYLLQSRTDEAIVWFEKANSANPGMPQRHAALVVKRVETIRRPGGFGGDQLRAQCRRNPTCDFVLQGKQVARVTVKPFRPQVRVGLGINELCGDADLLARSLNTSFQHIANAQLAAYLLRVDRLVLIVNALLRDITSMSEIRDRSVVRSSVTPSANIAAQGRC